MQPRQTGVQRCSRNQGQFLDESADDSGYTAGALTISVCTSEGLVLRWNTYH